VLGLAACGGDSSDDTSSAAGSSSPASSAAASDSSGSSDSAGTTLTATEDDFSIALSSDSVAPGTYTVSVENAGNATHSLSIKGPGGVDETSDTLQGGDSATMTVTLEAGEYEVWCPIGNHKAMGMDTTLTVG
jgi:plastocyanin